MSVSAVTVVKWCHATKMGVSTLNAFSRRTYKSISRTSCLISLCRQTQCSSFRPSSLIHESARRMASSSHSDSPISRLFLGESPPSHPDSNSSGVGDSSSIATFEMPEVPAQVMPVPEPSLYDLGLANATPSGLVQSVLEILHVDYGLSWAASIVALTIAIRSIMFPLFITSQRASINLHNNASELNRIRDDLMRLPTGSLEHRMQLEKLKEFGAKHGCSQSYILAPMLCQGAIMFSMFFSLRGLAEAGVPSMKTGGWAWFTDLTVGDPLYALPIITTASVFMIFKLGGDVDLKMLPKGMRNMLYGMVVVSVPFMCQFPAALNLYWMVSNFFGITQAQLTRMPRVRTFFNLPARVKPTNGQDVYGFDSIMKQFNKSRTELSAAERKMHLKQRAEWLQKQQNDGGSGKS